MLNLFTPSKAKSHREKKVSDLIRMVLSEIIIRRDLPPVDDGNLQLLVPVTVTYVKMSPDLKIAYVYIIPMGGAKQEETMEYFKKASGHIRHLLGKRIHLKSTPELKFFIDPTFDRSKRIEEIFEDIKEGCVDEK